LVGVQTGDDAVLEDTPTFTFSSSDVGTDLSITSTGYSIVGTDAGNYILTQPTLSADIFVKSLNVTGVSGLDKIYDGTSDASVIGVATLSGVESGDVVNLDSPSSFDFSSSDVGTDLSITSTGYSIVGTDAGNYILTQPALSADITAKSLNVTGVSGLDKIYDGTSDASVIGVATLSGVESGDIVNLDSPSSFDFSSSDVGTDLSITSTGYSIVGTDAGNYILTQPTLSADIKAKSLSVTGVSGLDKIYDGTTDASVDGAAILSGVESGDVVNLDSPSSFDFSSSDVGTDLSITSTGYSIVGTDAGNYI